MKLLICIALFLSVSPLSLIAQKDAPVIGHVATLVDLMKKDYSSIDPSLRQDEISRDRSLVISIFKSYLTDANRQGLQSSAAQALAVKNENISRAMDTMNQLKGYLSTYSTITANLREEKAAIAFAEKIEDSSKKLQAVQNRYYLLRTDADVEELGLIMVEYRNNQFLSNMLDQFRTKYLSLKKKQIDNYASVNNVASIQKSIPFIGGNLYFETLIDGLGRFLAKRIKEELTTYMVERVKRWLSQPTDTDPLAEFKVLLPKTTAYLKAFDADKIINFPNEIKQFIEDDLSHTLENAGNLRNTSRVRMLLENHPDLDFAFEALELIPSIAKVKYVTDYFTFLENSRNVSRWKNDPIAAKKNIANAVYFAGLLSRSLVVIDNGEPRFAGVDFLTSYAQETPFFMLYAGFLHQQNLKYYNIEFGGAVPFVLQAQLQNLVNLAANVAAFDNTKDLFAKLLTKTSKEAEKIFVIATDIRKANKAGQKIGADTVYNFIDAVIRFSEDLTGNSFEMAQHLRNAFAPAVTVPNFTEPAKPYFIVARTTNEVIRDIRTRRYATGLLKAVNIAASLSKNENVDAFASLPGLTPAKFDGSAEKWGLFNEALLKVTTGNFELDKKRKEAANTVLNDLYRIELFYINHYPAGPLLSDIQTFRNNCQVAVQSGSMNNAAVLTLQALVQRNDFRDLLLSYYVGTVLNTQLSKLETAMTDLRTGQLPVAVFTAADAIQLTTAIRNYLQGAYRLYYLKDASVTNAVKQDLQTALQRIAYTMALLPNRFDGRLNTSLVSLVQFVNDIALSQDATDVEKAITAFALPSGSYSIKRRSTGSISINSYPGILVGGEVSYKENSKPFAVSVGFTAPVGLAFSKGNKNGSSLGIFIPIIDIGAITRLRLDNNNETQTLPDLSFKNILAPGFYVSYGFRNSPFSLNAGLQYGPELKEILPNKETKTYDSMRFGLGFVLDIPLVNLHTRRD